MDEGFDELIAQRVSARATLEELVEPLYHAVETYAGSHDADAVINPGVDRAISRLAIACSGSSQSIPAPAPAILATVRWYQHIARKGTVSGELDRREAIRLYEHVLAELRAELPEMPPDDLPGEVRSVISESDPALRALKLAHEGAIKLLAAGQAARDRVLLREGIEVLRPTLAGTDSGSSLVASGWHTLGQAWYLWFELIEDMGTLDQAIDAYRRAADGAPSGGERANRYRDLHSLLRQAKLDDDEMRDLDDSVNAMRAAIDALPSTDLCPAGWLFGLARDLVLQARRDQSVGAVDEALAILVKRVPFATGADDLDMHERLSVMAEASELTADITGDPRARDAALAARGALDRFTAVSDEPEPEAAMLDGTIALSDPSDCCGIGVDALSRVDAQRRKQGLDRARVEGDRAIHTFERGESASDATVAGAAASNLGVLLRQQPGDLEGAEAAFRRADERGGALGAHGLGVLLRETRGDLEGAEAAFRRADERGHPKGAYDLGVVLQQRGDLQGAEAAYRRADERGDADGTFNLGILLQQRGDLQGAEAAYRRAHERGDANGAYGLGVMLRQSGDLERAEAAFRSADELGHAEGAFNLGELVRQRGDLQGAEAAYRRAEERGDERGTVNLGLLLEQCGDPDGAEAALRRADERGDAGGAFNLGLLLVQRGDPEGAEAAFRRADERGDAQGTVNVGMLLQQRGDLEGAEAAYRRADKRGDAIGAYNLGQLLRKRGDLEEAVAAYTRAIESPRLDVSDAARKALDDLSS